MKIAYFGKEKRNSPTYFKMKNGLLHANIRQTMQSRACMQLVIIKRMNKTTINDMLK